MKLCNIYPNPVFQANEDLEKLAMSMHPDLFNECIKVSSYRSYSLTGSSLSMSEISIYIDDYCKKPGCIVKDFLHICVIRTQYPNFGAFRFFWVEADSDQIFSIVSRINKLKAFL